MWYNRVTGKLRLSGYGYNPRKEHVMGDKSPKNTQKQSKQKQAKKEKK
jgi:hypothetical protein